MSWSLSKARKVWIASSYSDLDGEAINSLAEYGEPFTPYQHPGWVEEFEPDFANVIVEMTQAEVMYHGYGRRIKPEDFPLIQRFLTGPFSIPIGTYDFNDLVRLKFANKEDRFISSNLYGWGPYSIDPGELSREDAAYVHGSVSFALMKGTRFSNSTSGRKVEAEIGAGDDNWDFNSSTIPSGVNMTVATLIGPDHYNLDDAIKIHFRGPGRRFVIKR